MNPMKSFAISTIARRAASALALGALVMASSPFAARALTLRPIVVDGTMSDWNDVLVDPDNAFPDRAGGFGDPDTPTIQSADRDARGFAFTWDTNNLYFWIRRTTSGNNAWHTIVYLDIDHNGVLNGSDRVLNIKFTGSSYHSSSMHPYVPVVGGGDPVLGDGQSQLGAIGAALTPAPAIAGAGSASGLEIEFSIPWGTTGLNVPVGTPFNLHVSLGRGTNLPSSVEDNMYGPSGINTQSASLTLVNPRFSSAAPGTTVNYAHLLTNKGNGTDTFDITLASSQGYAVALWSDPNGDGDPSDGALIARDFNGDGDFVDNFDTPPSAADDANGNGQPDGGVLATTGTRAFVVKVELPAGAPNGTIEKTTVKATSSFSRQVLASNVDTTEIGNLTVQFDDAQRLGVANNPTPIDAYHPNHVSNNGAVPLDVTLSPVSNQGWTTVAWTDPNGDGDPSDGVPIVGPITIPPGTTIDIVIVVTVPALTPDGTVSVTTVTASSSGPIYVDTCVDTLTVRPRVQLDPDNASIAVAGQVLYYPHTVTNAAPFIDNFNLSFTTSLGSTVTFLSDPNGNGIPDDSTGVPITSTGPVAAGGGTFNFIAKVFIPTSALAGSVDTVVVTASATVAPLPASDTATDVTTIQRLATYSDALFRRATNVFFGSCATIYTKAHGLVSNKLYRFQWFDSSSTLLRTSADIGPDADTNADDSYTLLAASPAGSYRIELYEKSGSSYGLIATHNFQVLSSSQSGVVAALTTDKPAYGLVGETIRVEAKLNNNSLADNLDTTASYVVFEDLDADQAPTAGELYITAAGTIATWSTGLTTHVTGPLNVFAGQTFVDDWQVGPVTFSSGHPTWTVRVRWLAPCQVAYGTRTTTFSVCDTSPLADAGPDVTICLGDSVQLGTPAVLGNTYLWIPATGLNNPTAAQPIASPTANITYSLEVRGANGCTALDSVNVVVDPSPTPGPVGNVVMGVKVAASINARYTWPAIPDAQKYNVYRGTVPWSLTLVTTTTNLYWDDPVLVDGIDYYYNVKAAACKEGP